MASGYSFIEATEFTAVLNPSAGAVIPGAGPLRKLRWKDARRGKSKRGGLRIVHIHIGEPRILFMLDVYDKDEADDLSSDEKKELRSLANALVQELRGEG